MYSLRESLPCTHVRGRATYRMWQREIYDLAWSSMPPRQPVVSAQAQSLTVDERWVRSWGSGGFCDKFSGQNIGYHWIIILMINSSYIFAHSGGQQGCMLPVG